MAHDPFGGLTGWDLEGFHNGGDTEVWRRLGSWGIARAERLKSGLGLSFTWKDAYDF